MQSQGLSEEQQKLGQSGCQNVLMTGDGLTQLLDKFCEGKNCM